MAWHDEPLSVEKELLDVFEMSPEEISEMY